MCLQRMPYITNTQSKHHHDTTVLIEGHSYNNIITILNNELYKIDTWLQTNKPSKDVMIRQDKIALTKSTKFLGIIIDDKLKFIVYNFRLPMMNQETSSRKRKYSEQFPKYGFTFIVEEGIEKPQCVICNEIMSAESMKPNKIK